MKSSVDGHKGEAKEIHLLPLTRRKGTASACVRLNRGSRTAHSETVGNADAVVVLLELH